MKTINITKLITLLSLSSLLLSSCASKKVIVRTDSSKDKIVLFEENKLLKKPQIEKGFKTNLSLHSKSFKSIKECTNCYATSLSYDKVSKEKKIALANITCTTLDKKIDTPSHNSLRKYAEGLPSHVSTLISKSEDQDIEKSIDGYEYRLVSEDNSVSRMENISKHNWRTNSTNVGYNTENLTSHVNGIAIQVGAFRRYAGAKLYARKYSLLSKQYKVTIQTAMKDQRPIHRVQIKGFSSRREATNFKNRYGLMGAFLVRR